MRLENLLLEQNGYIKIIDYRLSKILASDQVTTSQCGTPEYLAPEILRRRGYNRNVDWWATGILIYEMIFGGTPFFQKNKQVLYFRINTGELIFPNRAIAGAIQYSDTFVDLVTQLLNRNPTERLGAKQDAQEILAHPWFSDIDLERLKTLELNPPIYHRFDDYTDENAI